MLHTADHPAFADTEIAGNVSLFPLGVAGVDHTARAPQRAEADRDNDLRYSFSDGPRPVGEQRLREAVSAAYRNGKADGRDEREREGWASAVHWGMFVGAFGTCLTGALILMGLVLRIGRNAPLF